MPIVIYSLGFQIVPLLPLKIFTHSDKALLTIAQISLVCVIVLLLSLFPLATKHLWCFIAQCVENKRPDAGWINTKFDRTKLPLPVYSWQVIVLNGLIPIALSFAIIRYCGMLTFSGSEVFFKMYVILYVSQFTVLYNISKERNYFPPNPRLIISWRMLGTLTATIVFPIIVGVAILPLYIRFLGETNWTLGSILFLVILAFLPFPYYMNQSLLLLAKKNDWAPERSEIMEAGTGWSWWVCLAAAISCMIIWWVLYCFKIIDFNSVLDVTQKLKL